jgi:hypothetical protein
MSLNRQLILGAALTAATLLSLGVAAEGFCQASPLQSQAKTDARQRDLERDAAVNLSLAKKSIQDDAFYNARVALNVWKSSAIAAGSFDKKLYEELRKQLYEKSIRDNLRCIESSISQRAAPDANQCLKIYRLHSQEIGQFDPKRYEELKKRVAAIPPRKKQ